ncbi:L-seryl-tRNA(Sec) selenium transferase [Telmatospirillum sp. J64-1]|uniref:L-seryl-tRNA(Sec) selenium transferase n=1 Tax=Telmatospirillum sp. J64-1 TaxID=2502183 RepID=UPI00115F55E7|nr:L-seryl-tRNA(Sec) selenium transferase [Telmatospirillum sp. J64-1]
MSQTRNRGSDVLRALPQTHLLLEMPEAQALREEFSRRSLTRAVRARLGELRQEWRHKDDLLFSPGRFFAEIRARLERESRPHMCRVINATGIVIHTNLGRAPLPSQALTAVVEAAEGYSNLEFDLEDGRRGSRYGAVPELLRELTGAEAALVVNNNAAAVLLALSALAQGGEVVVSRGELVEIGGSFRIPEVIAQGGARLVEVGTTNRTRTKDYEAALGPETRAFLKVHQSNYRITGFTAAPPLADLVTLAHGHGLPVIEDLGSGTLIDLPALGLPHEPTVREIIKAGVDLVTFSGDKLLGGPQAGLIVGRKALIERLKAHPLLRALRIDKLNLAALEATLRLYRDADRPQDRLPVLSMLSQDIARLESRAHSLAEQLSAQGWDARVEVGQAEAGGGALPGAAIATRLVTIGHADVTGLARRLRLCRPAVVARLHGGRLVLDMRSVSDEEANLIAQAFRQVSA